MRFNYLFLTLALSGARVLPVKAFAEEVETPVGEVATPTVDVPFTITNEVPEDSKPVEEQLSLF